MQMDKNKLSAATSQLSKSKGRNKSIQTLEDFKDTKKKALKTVLYIVFIN